MSLDLGRLEEFVEGFRRVQLLVVGDLVLDEYVWGEVERVSPEAPVPVVHVFEETRVLGGAGNVARNVTALGGRVAFCGVVGDDDSGRHAADLLKHLGVDPEGLAVAPGRATPCKTRVVARNQQIVRFDRETADDPPLPVRRRLLASLESALPGCDGVVVGDYGKGTFSRATASRAMQLFEQRGIDVFVDPKDEIVPYRGAALVKPNLAEAAALAGLPVGTPEEIDRAIARLRRRTGGAAWVVTRGGDGMALYDGNAPRIDVPTVAREVFDVQGAGDTTIAVLALARRVGASLLEAAVIANAAAGVVVGKVGTATAEPDEVRRLLPAAVAAAEGRS